ncbi:MAG: hypothetical protein ABI901_18450, partial [Roseiflexaceae bacterium]
PIPPNDFWWHMATGRAIIAQGAIPVIDSFSYTQAGQPFFNQGWLAQLLMYGFYQLGGLPLTYIVQALVIALAYGLLLRLCLLRTGQVQLSVGLLLLTTLPLSFDNWLVRPQSYAFPLFAGFLTILTEYRLGGKNRLWLLPLLMVLWVNIHGSFVLGGVLIAGTLAAEWLKRWGARWREATSWANKPIGAPEDVLNRPAPAQMPPLTPLLLWGVATALALLLNPRGLAVIGYVRNLLGTSAVTNLVTEWAPPTIRDPGGIIFFLFLFVCIAVLIYARRRPDLTDLLLFFAFLWNALSASRNIVWFGFVATLLVVTQAATLISTPKQARSSVGSPTLNAVLIGLLVLLLALALPWWKAELLPPSVGALLTEDTPVNAVAYLHSQPDRPRRLFHTEAYGSYLIWQAPEQPVFIDTRIELYPIEQWRDYINLGQGNNVATLLQKYAIDGLLLDVVRQKGLIEAVRRDGTWVERYKDEHTVYFTPAARP